MINYPNKKVIKNDDEIITTANRGMDLEHAINLSNQFYDDDKRAIITKRPTPIHVVKVDYKHDARIVDAYFEKQSTTDYNGVYRGKYIDFEAKETQSKTSLTFRNISPHQIAHLKKVLYFGGIAFFIIYFKSLDKVFLVDSTIIIQKYEENIHKSITLKECEEKGVLIEQGYIPRLKYLDAVDKVYFDEKNK